MLDDLEAQREIEGARDLERTSEVDGVESRLVDEQPGSVHVCAVDPSQLSHAAVTKHGEPGSASAAHVHDAARLNELDEERNNDARRRERILFLLGEEDIVVEIHVHAVSWVG